MMLHPNMPAIDDPEGAEVPPGLPAVIDAHVHIFPDSIFSSVRKWFDVHGWHIRYRMSSSAVCSFLLARGVRRIVAFQYAHKPGIAEELNAYMVAHCREFAGKVAGLATVFPGEQRAEQLLQKAFDDGLAGLKLHAHVQCFDMNGESMYRLYDCCARNGKPVVMHIGREPKSAAYRCDPYQLCSAAKFEQVVRDFPDLRICVPHLGIDEVEAYRKMIERYDNVWLDTTMALAGYLPLDDHRIDLGRYRSDRVMYGSDFPNIPYAWDRELKAMTTGRIAARDLERILGGNAVAFFGLEKSREIH